ncbi:MAG TPA: hypothetical protein VFY93_12460 [Planctomycetota bacterium]|nr:hypothetical protein [Planctomycetota bacterium]
MEEIAVGSLVAPAPSYRSAMGTGEGAAILMAILRGSGRLYYPATDSSFWVPLRLVREIPPEALPEECLETFLSRLFLSLAAEECVAERIPAGLGLSIEMARLTRAAEAELEGRLGDRLIDLEIVPASMRSITLRLELGSLPPAAGAGR